MIDDVSVGPQNGGKPEYLVIFFHGLGSSGQAMAEHVGKLLGPELPGAKLRFPDAPLEEMPDGRVAHSWFPVYDLIWGDKMPDSDEIGRRATTAATAMNTYIDKVIAEEGIPADKVIIAGFSQGATMAYYAGLLRESPVAGVFSLSGGALDRLKSPKAKPPVGILAGGDEQNDYSGAPHARKAHEFLEKQAGFFTDCVIIEGQGHDITPKSMELLGVFTRAVTSDAFRAKLSAAPAAPSPPPKP